MISSIRNFGFETTKALGIKTVAQIAGFGSMRASAAALNYLDLEYDRNLDLYRPMMFAIGILAAGVTSVIVDRCLNKVTHSAVNPSRFAEVKRIALITSGFLAAATSMLKVIDCAKNKLTIDCAYVYGRIMDCAGLTLIIDCSEVYALPSHVLRSKELFAEIVTDHYAMARICRDKVNSCNDMLFTQLGVGFLAAAVTSVFLFNRRFKKAIVSTN